MFDYGALTVIFTGLIVLGALIYAGLQLIAKPLRDIAHHLEGSKRENEHQTKKQSWPPNKSRQRTAAYVGLEQG